MIMNKELVINMCKKEYRVFLREGFWMEKKTSRLHKHSYPEIHIINADGVGFKIGEEKYVFDAGDVIIIPSGVFHCYEYSDEIISATAFQTDLEVKGFLSHRISRDIIREFFYEINECRKSDDYGKISAFIQLFLNYFKEEKVCGNNIADYKFLICEFFSTNYNKDIYLKDLAKELKVSERQAERLMIEHTGRTFREELTKTRITTAKELLKTTDMTLTEISSYVGYRSYAGFWKAMKRY